MALIQFSVIEGTEVDLVITDPNPLAPKAGVKGITPRASSITGWEIGTELTFVPLGDSGKEWITGSFILRDWEGDGLSVDFSWWNA